MYCYVDKVMEDKVNELHNYVPEVANFYTVYSEYLLEDLDIDGGITLKCMLRKQNVDLWAGFTCLRVGPKDGLF